MLAGIDARVTTSAGAEYGPSCAQYKSMIYAVAHDIFLPLASFAPNFRRGCEDFLFYISALPTAV